MGLANPRSCSLLAQILLGWAMVSSATHCVGPTLRPLPAWAQTPPTLAPGGYVDLDGLWVFPLSIPVCWEFACELYTEEKRWVKDAVLTHISGGSSVCPSRLKTAPHNSSAFASRLPIGTRLVTLVARVVAR
jgi:hypothetical protein